MNTKELSGQRTVATARAVPAGSNGTPKRLGPELKANILLVDDRPDKLLALEVVLETLGQNLVRAMSGKDALRRLLHQDFAVILLDVSMPGMDGFETASLIRQRLSSEHTPIIFITSIGTTDNHVSRGYSLGAVDYLLTPIVPEVLRSKVSVFVELHKKSELVKLQAEQLRRNEETRHQRELAEVADRLEIETRRNRFFTLAIDLLGIADFDGRLLQLNPAWERVLGFHPDELKNVAGVDLVHPEERSAMADKMEALKQGTTIADFEGRYRHKQGGWRWLQWTATPFPSEKLIYIFARDVTARKNAESQVMLLTKELEQRVADLTVANVELEAFNYSIAHDLRAPLRAMMGFSKALLQDETGNLSATGLDYTRRIAHSAKFMDALLLDMLTYSRLTKAEVSPKMVVLEEPITELLSLLEKETQEAGIKIEVVGPLGPVYAHAPTLKQVLSNLVGNALKFTAPDRSPFLRISTTREAGFVRIWVEDNGIGIAPEHHERIFGLFQRLADAQKYPGTGVGLALVKKGAERMGGRVGVESVPGQGSRFWVELPEKPASSDGT
ncbi:MAG TPA: ATP-binding protein [Candidatus Limnocylindrales bacterium]|jgi:PAS domain S-box-containing protein|nr:ATP-binding protein [Candidatus Limnocylindrales bacterium]